MSFDYTFFSPVDADWALLEEEIAEIASGWLIASCTNYDPMHLGRVQSAANVVTYGPLAFLFVLVVI